MNRWGWQGESPSNIRRPCGRPIHLLDCSATWITEQIKEALRKQIMPRLTFRKEREDHVGLETLDRQAAAALVRGCTIPALRVNTKLMRSLHADLLTGSFRPARRLWRAGRWHTPDCPCCAHFLGVLVPGAKRHVFWRCAKWDSAWRGLRHELEKRGFKWEDGKLPVDPLVTEAFLCCGLPSEDLRLRAEQATRPPETYHEELPPFRDPDCWDTEKWRKCDTPIQEDTN